MYDIYIYAYNLVLPRARDTGLGNDSFRFVFLVRAFFRRYKVWFYSDADARCAKSDTTAVRAHYNNVRNGPTIAHDGRRFIRRRAKRRVVNTLKIIHVALYIYARIYIRDIQQSALRMIARIYAVQRRVDRSINNTCAVHIAVILK